MDLNNRKHCWVEWKQQQNESGSEMKCFFFIPRQGMLLKLEGEGKKNINETCWHAIRHYLILFCVLSERASKRVGRKISIIINGSFYLHYVSMSAAAAPALCHLTHFCTTFKSKHVQERWGVVTASLSYSLLFPIVVIWDNFPGCVITDEWERANYDVQWVPCCCSFPKKTFPPRQQQTKKCK